jgi:glyoxalase family protein
MPLEGIHHITAITADAPANVAFYTGVLGLRLVKKTVNQDDPSVYHLFYGDRHGTPGFDLTFFEYPHAALGQAGAGMVHRIAWRVRSIEALEFWAERLNAHGVAWERGMETLRFADPEGLEHELVLDRSGDEPLLAEAPGIPRELALAGFDGVRVYAEEPGASRRLLQETLGFLAGPSEDGWEVRGDARGAHYRYDPAPSSIRGRQGAGTVHHVAFAAQPEDEDGWRERVAAAGAHATAVIDRFYFRSVYFREPSGVLMEIATLGPGFGVDEDPDHLGERLSLPPKFEHLREKLERELTPLTSRYARASSSGSA